MTRRIEIDVIDADGTTVVDTLASDGKRSFLKDLEGEGAHDVEIKLGHADEDLLTYGRILRYKVDGTARWQGLIEQLPIVYADPNNRKAGQVMRCSGRGTLALFEWAVLYPELGLGRISPGHRYFNPASFDFDESGWGTATAFHEQGTTDPADAYEGYPQGFPDGAAYWIGPSDGITSLPAPIGFWWVVKEFTIASGQGGDYRFSFGVDDGLEIFVDGNREFAESRVGMWGVTREITLSLDEGAHRIACRVENFDRPNPSTNATALVLSVAKELAGGAALDTPVVATDSTWKFLQVTGTEPGMTVGHFLTVLVAEAQAAGFLDGITLGFDADEDSAGTTWPVEIDLAFPVGMTYLEILRHLIEEHACDVEMSATGLVLHAYVSKGDDLSASVAVTYGDNISRLAFARPGPGGNVALSQTAEGRWVERERTSSATAWGRRAIHVTQGAAPSESAADRQIEAVFDDTAEPVESITDLQIEEVTAVPFADFDTGDIVSATSSDGTTADCRVYGIRVAEDRAGNPVWTPDLVKVAS